MRPSPQGPYPVFLFLFKFFFEFPDFPLEALDVFGELGNGLGLLDIPTARPGRTSGPAKVTQKGKSSETIVFQKILLLSNHTSSDIREDQGKFIRGMGLL